jgi:ATP-binding cassette subfamily B protein
MLTARVAERFRLRLRDTVYAHAQRLAPDFHQRYGVGNLVARHSGDLDGVEHLVGSGIVQTFVAALSAVSFAAAVWIRWDLALAAFAMAPLFWLAAKWFSGKLKHGMRRALRQQRDQLGRRGGLSHFTVIGRPRESLDSVLSFVTALL